MMILPINYIKLYFKNKKKNNDNVGMDNEK